MLSPRYRRPGLAILVVVSLSACSSHSSSPTSPSGPAITISNLQVRQAGLEHVVCGTDHEYATRDEITFDVKMDGFNMVGSNVFDDGGRTLIGTVQTCAADTGPCSMPTSVCLTSASDASSTVRVFTKQPWTPVRTWNISLKAGDRQSNVLSSTFTRPDALPYGDRAGIAFLDSDPGIPARPNIHALVYSPGITGRVILLTRQEFSGDALLYAATSSLQEKPGVQLTGTMGLAASGATRIVALMEERDASGVVLATDRKELNLLFSAVSPSR